MGIVIDYKCICGYSQRIFEGEGFRAMNVNLISKHFPDESKYIVQHNEDAKPYSIKNVLGKCDYCKKLASISKLEYTYEGKKCEKFNGCPTCGKDIDIISNSLEVNCPKCDELMIASYIGHWD